MSTLNIKDRDVHQLAVELAVRTNQSLTKAVKESLQESLARHRSGREEPIQVVERVMRIGRGIAALPVVDSRTPEQILGYNECGLPE